MNTTAILALIADLYSQVLALTQEVAALREQIVQAQEGTP